MTDFEGCTVIICKNACPAFDWQLIAKWDRKLSSALNAKVKILCKFEIISCNFKQYIDWIWRAIISRVKEHKVNVCNFYLI
jgi:hypothetical protein